MQVKFANKISAEELKALPSGTVISFGDFCWVKYGLFWRDEPAIGGAEELCDLVEEERAAAQIKAIMHLLPDKYPQFSIITPYNEEAFGEVVWSEADIENAFEQLDYKATPEMKAAVLNKVEPIIGEKMIERGWDVIYNAVEEVCGDAHD